MPQDILIRRVSVDDVSAVLPCLASSALADAYFTDQEKTRQIVRRGITEHEAYKAWGGEVCVSYLTFMPQGMFGAFPYCHILAVRAGHRNSGIGSALLDEFEDDARREGTSRVFLEVDDFNPDARRLYERCGYTCASGRSRACTRPG